MTAPQSISLLAQLAAQQAANKGTAAAGTEKKPAPKLYVNVGIEHPTLGFVSLPFNLALDDMKHREVKGSDEWKVRAEISNWLLDNLRGAITELPPGSEGAVMVDELKVQLFHRGEAAPADQATVESALAALPAFTMRKATGSATS
mgnify:FL=1